MASYVPKIGRPSRYDSAKSGDLVKLTTDWLIANFGYFDRQTKIKVALIIAPKGIIEKHEVTGKIERDEEMDAMFSDWRRQVMARPSANAPQCLTIDAASGASNPRLEHEI